MIEENARKIVFVYHLCTMAQKGYGTQMYQDIHLCTIRVKSARKTTASEYKSVKFEAA